MMNSRQHLGWIKIHRKITDWEWYSDPNTRAIFLHLLFTVNFEAKKWRGITIPAGSRISGRHKLSQETGLSEQAIRTAIRKLSSTSEITTDNVSGFTLYKVNKWSEYQIDNQQSNQTATSKKNTFSKKSEKINHQINQESTKEHGSKCGDSDLSVSNQPATQPSSNQPSTISSTTTKEDKESKKVRKDNTTTSGGVEYSDSFLEFWNEYPRKVGKGAAWRAWKNAKAKPELELIMLAVRHQKNSEQWRKNGGQFIPHPQTWLNQRRWEDEGIAPAQQQPNFTELPSGAVGV